MAVFDKIGSMGKMSAKKVIQRELTNIKHRIFINFYKLAVILYKHSSCTEICTNYELFAPLSLL